MTNQPARLALVLPFTDPSTEENAADFVGAHTPDNVGARAPTLSGPSDRHNNPLKSRISLWLDTDLLAEFKQYAHSNGLTFSQAFEQGARIVMDGGPQLGRSVGARPQVLDIDLDLDDLKPIIDLHFVWTAAYNATVPVSGQVRRPRWTDKDTAAARKIDGNDIRVIELGIIHTLNKIPPESGPIRTFRYYLPEIYKFSQQTRTMPTANIEAIHRAHAEKMKRHLGLSTG